MVEDDRDPLDEPVVRPRLLGKMKDRPRLVDKGFRRDLLDELETEIEERRKPEVVGERVSSAARKVADRPVSRTIARKASEANTGLLEKL